MAELAQADRVVAAVVDAAFAAEHFPALRTAALWPSRLPGAAAHWTRYAIPMMAAWSTLKVEADLLVISSHFAAHGAAVRFSGPSIVYYHTPARLLWCTDMELDRVPSYLRPVVRSLLPVARLWDKQVAQHASFVLANSYAVKDRIRHAYEREAVVLHPPVDVAKWGTVKRSDSSHLLWLGRLVAYKKPWLAIETARRLGKPLVMIGDGPLRQSLEAGAPPNVVFLGHAEEASVRDTMASASVLMTPGVEDFGIAAVEALAAGVPVVAYAAGGALDYVRDGQNGLLVDCQSVEAFEDATRRALAIRWDHQWIRESAKPFSSAAFDEGFARVLAAAGYPGVSS